MYYLQYKSTPHYGCGTKIEDAGFARGNQSVDTTHVIANIAIQVTIGMIRQGIKAIMEERAHVEPKHAEMKRFHGMTRAKYWGLPNVSIQLIITAITVNVKRLANVLNSVCYLKTC
ncbi:MAG: Transposase DDE domain protein [Candidatus Argoarchaeum ethanivorans]|uniref:Transposase DDE domain protein n=1 Tax=Candidatus Argoarchaeum ethanivorans TaxID=2608793 RepID=A0A811T8I0_9EURY|nr:MAG: Transposase DDE domain protein [Candidatus Argoarchaeum ethanivorans]